MSPSTIGAEGACSAAQSCPWVNFVWPDPTQPISWLIQSNPTHHIWTQPNTTNNGAYSLVATYFIPYTEIISYF